MVRACENLQGAFFVSPASAAQGRGASPEVPIVRPPGGAFLVLRKAGDA